MKALKILILLVIAVLLVSCKPADDLSPPNGTVADTIANVPNDGDFVPPKGMSPDATVTAYLCYWEERSLEKMETLLTDFEGERVLGDQQIVRLISIDNVKIIDDVPAYLADMAKPSPNQKPAELEGLFYFDPPSAVAYVGVTFLMELHGDVEEMNWYFTLEKETAESDWIITNSGGPA